MTSPKPVPKIVVGVDPGDNIGIFSMKTDPRGEFTQWRETTSITCAVDYIFEPVPQVVVVENYIVRPHRPQNATQALKTIGVVEYLCNGRGIPMIMQQPSIPDRYKDQAKERVASGRHARSACAHVLYYLDRLRYGK